jgi:hypothetical protein
MIDKKTYLEQFAGKYDGDSKQARAWEHALDIRKFEIEHYWKRATYFWTFIAASFAGYGAVQNVREPARADLSVVLGCLGLVFSFGWYLSNRGSKRWQGNWEGQVDVLEDDVIGPLYKTIAEPASIGGNPLKRLATGSGPYSVSKINQIISLFVVFIWLLLIWHALPPFGIHNQPNWLYVAATSGSLLFCVMLAWWGRTGDSTEITLSPRTVNVTSNAKK